MTVEVNTRPRLRAAFRAIRVVVAAMLAVVVLSNVIVWQRARGRVIGDVAQLSGQYDALILPGAGVFANGEPSPTLRARIDAAVHLYERGIVDHLLVSGDNSTPAYDEPATIQRFLEKREIPLADITLDDAGFSTWQTCVRARKIFGVQRAVFVTQDRFSNRAASLCDAAGIDVDVLALENLRLPWYFKIRRTIREPIAAVKSMYEVTFRPNPEVLGEYVGLTGSGQGD